MSPILHPKGGSKFLSEITVIVHSSFEETQFLATAIADDCSRAEIESHSTLVHHDSGTWFDIERADTFTKEHLHRAVQYLYGRGLLLKHPKNAFWVHLVEAEADLNPA